MSRIRTVQQLTSKTTQVSVNAYDSIVQTVALTDAANGEFQFTVANDVVQTISTIMLTPIYDGTGTPVVRLVSQTKGSFVINVTNKHASAAFNAALKIAFRIVHN